jgi:putative ABC transport system substrate-binding protein
VHLQPLLVTGPDEFEAAFTSIIKQGSEGLIVQPLFVGHRGKLAELAARHRLAMIADQAVFARAGGLVAYGVSRRVIFQRQAFYVDKIMKGAKPAELPVEQASKYELIINMKTAKALGLEVPPTLLSRADEVIE